LEELKLNSCLICIIAFLLKTINKNSPCVSTPQDVRLRTRSSARTARYLCENSAADPSSLATLLPQEIQLNVVTAKRISDEPKTMTTDTIF
jgi:hypothetical protein